jgi:hypothetical protein
MAKLATEVFFTGSTTSISSYDSTKTNLGPLINQYTGVNATDKFAGPEIIAMARPMEASTSITGGFVSVIPYSTNIDWVFMAEGSAAAATRRIIVYEFDKTQKVFTWKGFITLTYPTATTHTVRGFQMTRDLYTVGTVAVSGTSVTGTGSAWLSSSLSVGSRIGFGTTDPTAVTTWYEISAIGSGTTITLTGTAGTITAGTSYVIEDMRCYTTTTNATVTNGGLFVTKGLRYELFSNSGTIIPAATTVDNIRAVYWLSDAATQTMTVGAGFAIDAMSSWTNQVCYIINMNAVTTPSIYVYNVRAALTLAAGKDNTTNTIKTGIQTTVGNVSQVNNGILATLSHGPGSGTKCIYFATTTRIYRVALAGITAASVSFLSDAMLETPPGSTTTYAASGNMTNVVYASSIDRLVVFTIETSGQRNYVTKYNTTSNQFDHIFLIDDKNQDQSAADAGSTMFPSIAATQMTGIDVSGRFYLVRLATTISLNQLYTIPIGAHWTYASTTNNMLITPAISTTSASKLYRVYVNEIQKLGTDAFTLTPEVFKLYVRTSGISDNSGAWTAVTDDGGLTSISPSTQIQFMMQFNTIGRFCFPARILSVALLYEDSTTDSHYFPSVANSSISSNVFAFRQAATWGGTIPNLRIRLFNASTGVALIDDNVTSSAFGIWQYSNNSGGTWNTWSSTADVVGNYIRYTANSLPGSISVRALLTQA